MSTYNSGVWLFAISSFSEPDGWCHRTMLMRGESEQDARAAVVHKLNDTHTYVGKGKKQSS